jgi:hypothetical protein
MLSLLCIFSLCLLKTCGVFLIIVCWVSASVRMLSYYAAFCPKNIKTVIAQMAYPVTIK